VNGESLLTGVQKHGLVDTIHRGGALVSAWENDDSPPKAVNPNPNPLENTNVDAEKVVSPVYSIDVQSEGVWCVTGTESGAINLFTVRHHEGKLIHSFRGHKGIVSVLRISPDEQTLLSGGWDKSVKLWSLDNGTILKDFRDASTPIMDIVFHPKNTSVFCVCSFDGTVYIYDLRTQNGLISKITSQVSQSPPWALSCCWSADGSKLYVGRRHCQVDELDVQLGTCSRVFKLPSGSGPVFHVAAMENGRNLIMYVELTSASNDNIRLWDMDYVPEPLGGMVSSHSKDKLPQPDILEELNKDPFDLDFLGKQASPARPIKKLDTLTDFESTTPLVPFTVIPGHHGGLVSKISNCL
jgi:transcriptional activator SPT8